MEKLFPDSEVMLNVRPTNITEEQEQELCVKFATEIIKSGWSSDDVEDIAKDLSNINPNYEGFEAAKSLEDYSNEAKYNIDSEFVAYLDCFNHERGELLRKNIKGWVKAFDIKPKFNKGDNLFIEKSLNFKLKKDTTIFVSGINYAEANYYLHENPQNNGGYVLTFEDVESKCKIYNNEDKN
jgi:hypothetical protein